MARRTRSLGLFALPVILAGCAVAPEGESGPEGAAPPETVDAANVTPAAVHEAWFVELEEPPLARGGDPIVLQGEKARFRSHAASARLPIQERYAFDRLWNGVSVNIDHRSAPVLATLPGVKRIFPVVPITLDKAAPVIVHPTGKVSTGPTSAPDLFTALAMTGADIAQSSLGLTGTGIRVGVIDTGIDINHPDLGGTPAGCFGPGCRVRYGYDFVGDNYDSATSGALPVPDAIPDDCAGHGTHVAGIIGANGTVKGVAPNVTFGAYRVFGCSGSTSGDVMIKAMEMAEADGMRVVNMSIGSSFQWPDYPTATAADQLVKDGVIVVSSIGNSGNTTGPGPAWSAGAPGVGRNVIGVASYDNTAVAQPAFTVSGSTAKFGFNPATGAPPPPLSGSFPLARTGTQTTVGDGCVNAPAAGSLTGQVVLIRRGSPAAGPTCGFYAKAFNAMSAGAVGVVLYNNAAGQLSPTVAGTPAITIPVVAITAADGATLDTMLAAGSVTLTWGTQTASLPNPTAGQVSSFSSWGLGHDLSFKPDLGAPGGSIYSTYPLELGAYASLSGTSMSSPHVAGAVALMLEARPEIPPLLMRDVLQNTAVPAPWPTDTTVPDAVAHQGAGMIHVDVAAQTLVTVSPGKLALGESQAGAVTKTLTLTNEGTGAVTYDLTSVAAASTVPSASGYWTPTLAGGAATGVSFGAPSVTVPAGGVATVNVTITADGALTDGTIYGGYLVFTPQGGGTVLRVPYAGYKGDYQALTILTGAGKAYPWLAKRSGANFVNQASGATFTLQSGNVPYVVAHLEHAARRIKIDVYDAVKSKPYGNVVDTEYVGSGITNTDTISFAWDGTTVFNKSPYKVPNGTYVLKLSALKALGDANNPADWETWTSPVVTLNHP